MESVVEGALDLIADTSKAGAALLVTTLVGHQGGGAEVRPHLTQDQNYFNNLNKIVLGVETMSIGNRIIPITITMY
jgi:hypothetical protein